MLYKTECNEIEYNICGFICFTENIHSTYKGELKWRLFAYRAQVTPPAYVGRCLARQLQHTIIPPSVFLLDPQKDLEEQGTEEKLVGGVSPLSSYICSGTLLVQNAAGLMSLRKRNHKERNSRQLNYGTRYCPNLTLPTENIEF